MKTKNVFITFIFICVSLIISFSGSFSVVTQTHMLSAQGVTGTPKLFDEKGEYNYGRYSLSKGAVFNFFGYDWKVVNIKGDIATFWMVEPYTKQKFRVQTHSSADQNMRNTWSNGYYAAEWQGNQLGESDIRKFLNSEAKRIIDNSEFKEYKDKVVPGYVLGSNEIARGTTINKVFYSKESVTHYISVSGQTLSVDYGLSTNNVDDRLWLPSYEEIKDNGLWKLNNSYRNWQNTTVSALSWLRSPSLDASYKGHLVGFSTSVSSNSNFQSIYSAAIDQSYGVRPAIHLNIKSAGSTVEPPRNWFNDDVMKTFFVIICSIGIMGVLLVIIAVVQKHKEKKE